MHIIMIYEFMIPPKSWLHHCSRYTDIQCLQQKFLSGQRQFVIFKDLYLQ